MRTSSVRRLRRLHPGGARSPLDPPTFNVISDGGDLTRGGARSILRALMRSSRRAELFPQATDSEWRDWRWQLRNSVRSLDQLERLVPLTEDERRGCEETASVFRLGISPYYLS